MVITINKVTLMTTATYNFQTVCSKVNTFEALLDSKLNELDNGDYCILVVDYKNLTFTFEHDDQYIADMTLTSFQDAMKITEYNVNDHADIKDYFTENAMDYYKFGSMPW